MACIGFFGLYFFLLLFQFCLGIFEGIFLVEELLNSTSYKYSQVSNSDVPVISSIDKVYAPFCVCVCVCLLLSSGKGI